MPTRPPGTPDVDLTFDGASGTINGGVFMTGLYEAVPDQFHSFLEIRNNGVEQGYNTDGALQQDQRDTQNSTHSILLAEVPIVIGDGSNGTVEGVAYREFRLNLAEAGNTKQYLSLDALQIWQEEAGNLTNFTAGSGFAGAHTNHLAYDLDAGADRWIGLKEGANGNGADQTEFTFLIPDSYFINDPAHRYVTLYSKFGVQAGWDADSSSEQWGLSHASGGPVSAMTVQKTATVPGGTANAAGEEISYSISVANVGNTALTGVTVTDPSVSNVAALDANFDGFNDGDANLDNALSAGETWQYTASYTVTQNDLDTNGGGEGFISNTVTADSAQTAPVSASTLVVVESGASLEMTKAANVSSVDAAGDVINYTVNVTNTGNTSLFALMVTDPQFTVITPVFGDPVLSDDPLQAPVMVGDYNAGDTNENGIEDPGETFQYVASGDEDQDGIEDDDENWQFANIGDANQNGNQDPGETFQFYNAGDTDHSGFEDNGETWQFNVNDQMAGVDDDDDSFNDGDDNHNDQLDVGETWQFTGSYTVTQADIDNGGVVFVPTAIDADDDGFNDGDTNENGIEDGLETFQFTKLTHDNTATATTDKVTGSASESVEIEQNPHVTLVKNAAVVGGVADQAGDVIHYRITVTNDGNMTLTNPVVSDPSVSGLAAVESGGFNAGDGDMDGMLDLGETWQYTASHTVTQADIDNGGVVDPLLTYDNTASVTTDQGTVGPNPDLDANDSDSASVPIMQNPHVTLVKNAAVVGGVADQAGDVIHYRITVTNDGNMTLTTPVVSDLSVSGLAAVTSGGFNAGDADTDGKLDLGETWQYTANHIVTQAEMDAGGSIVNTASVATDQGASDADANDSDTASITIVQNPSVTLAKDATVPGGTADTAGELISYTIAVNNNGNVSLTNPEVSDLSVSDLAAVMSGSFNAGDANTDGKLSVGETWQYTASHTVTQAEMDAGGTINNTASVETDQGASASDGASVEVVPALVLTKTSDPLIDGDESGGPSVADPIQYFFSAVNNGTVALHGMLLDDTLFGVIAFTPDTPDDNGFLDPGETWLMSETYLTTDDDIDAGFVDNEATVTGLTPTDVLVTSTTAQWHLEF